MRDGLLDASLTLRRNYADLPFDAATNENTARRVTERVMNALSAARESYAYMRPEGVSADKQEELRRNRLLCEDTSDCPYSALFLQTGANASVQTALQDHVVVSAWSQQGDLTACYAQGRAIAGRLDESGRVAFSRRYGHLTARLSDAGTGFRGAYLMHLPMLSIVNQLPVVMQAASAAGLLLRPASGDVAQPAGALFLLENRVTLGREEDKLINLLTHHAGQIIAIETQLRRKAAERGDEAVFDRPTRAFGVAQYVRKLSRREALNLWSSITLARSLGTIEATDAQLDKLYIAARGDQAAFDRNASGTQPDVARAACVRAIFREGKDQ